MDDPTYLCSRAQPLLEIELWSAVDHVKRGVRWDDTLVQ